MIPTSKPLVVVVYDTDTQVTRFIIYTAPWSLGDWPEYVYKRSSGETDKVFFKRVAQVRGLGYLPWFSEDEPLLKYPLSW